MSESIIVTALDDFYTKSPLSFMGGVYSFSPVGIPIAFILEAIGSTRWTLVDCVTSNTEVSLYSQYSIGNAAQMSIDRESRLTFDVSMELNGVAGWVIRPAVLMAFEFALKNHRQNGGWFTIVTPCGVFTDMVQQGAIEYSGKTDSDSLAQRFRISFISIVTEPEKIENAANAAITKLTKPSEGLTPAKIQ